MKGADIIHKVSGGPRGNLGFVLYGLVNMTHRPRCIKFAFERKSEKSNASPLMRDSDWLKLNLRLIFQICVQMQILCNRALDTINYCNGTLAI